ncbi:MAG: hypothetical protein ACQESR_17440 [Planctomycetota bacterium]
MESEEDFWTADTHGQRANCWRSSPLCKVDIGEGAAGAASAPQLQPQPASVDESDGPPQQGLVACSRAIPMFRQQQSPAADVWVGLEILDGQWQDSAIIGCSGIATAARNITHLVAVVNRNITCAIVLFSRSSPLYRPSGQGP